MIDIENLVAGVMDPTLVRLALSEYNFMVTVGRHDLVIVGLAERHQNLLKLRNLKIKRFKGVLGRNGPDGADEALTGAVQLIEAANPDWIKGFTHCVIGSGDGHFLMMARDLQRRDLLVVNVIGGGDPSWQWNELVERDQRVLKTTRARCGRPALRP